MDTIAVVTTIDSLDEARALAGALVERRLAACVQISEIESVYRWQGETRNEREYRVLAKTTAARYADVETAIRELHSYDLPAIHAFDMPHVYERYAEWIVEAVENE